MLKKSLTWWLFVSGAILMLSGGYLAGYSAPTLFYVFNIFLHAGLGVAFFLLLVLYLAKNVRELPLDARIAALALVLSGFTGNLLIWTGTSLPFMWLLMLHVAFSILGVGLVLFHLVRSRSNWKPLGVVFALALLFPLSVRAWYLFNPEPSWQIVNPTVIPTSMEEEGPGPASPFFPSAADTNVGRTIPSSFFMEPESCGTAGCHPDIVEQWNSSAHHFSSFNNQWYRKSIEYMQEVVGTQPSKWCAGCHDHAVFFNGMMDTPIKEIVHTPEAQRGLTCVSCHSIVAVNSTMGNAHMVIEYPPLHDLANSRNPFLRTMHDAAVHLNPRPHKNTFLKPFMRVQPAEFCSTCHKVHLDVPVNDYRWIRGFNSYDPWQMSGVSGQGARAFYYPDQPMDCVDCHMPLVPSNDAGNKDGFVRSHRFPGANTALPLVNKDEKQLQVVKEFLKAGQISVDIFAVSEADPREWDEQHQVPSPEMLQAATTFADADQLGFAVGRSAAYTKPRQVLAPIDKVRPLVRKGDTVRVDVVIRTLKVGHTFPAGTVDAFDVWVELKAEDETGRLLFWSGYVPEDEYGRKGPVDPGAHFYRSFLLDERGNHINKRNAWAARSVLYVRLIPPGAADTVHYRLQIPEDAGEKIFLTARVNYRKFKWWNTQFAFAGVRDPEELNPDVGPGYDDGRWVFTGDTSNVSGKLKEIPDLPVVTMAEAQAELSTVAAGHPLPEQVSKLDRADLIRWNDYGIGLLLQGDLKAAEEVFRRVTEIDPGYVDGWVNIGRVRVQEGRIADAEEVLLEALRRDPELAKTHFFLGTNYKRKGEYDKALEHLWKAESKYPRDRVVLNEIGRILFLQRRFQEAVEVLNRVLEIDLEDLQAHFNLMLSYRGLGELDKAERAQQIYLRLKDDESAQAITGPFRLANPHDNNERQAIHEHVSFPLEEIGKSTSQRYRTERRP